MSRHDFEVHIGFSNKTRADAVARVPPAWKRDPVLHLSSLREGANKEEYKEHNVDGKLAVLLTKHAKSIEDVQALVEEAAGYCRGEPTSRIEIEQVLVSSSEALDLAPLTELQFTPSKAAFPNLELIPETPPYEVHYCLSAMPGRPALTVAEVKAICHRAAIGIDEVVEFGGDAKITTTKFYKTLERMSSELKSDATRFLNAMNELATGIRFRLIAERIITCGIPV